MTNQQEMSRAEWLQLRKKGIGGSDAASVMGLNQYTERVTLPDGTERIVQPYSYLATAYQIWADKTGIEPRNVPDSLQMAAGRNMEPLILKQYEEVSGEKLLPHPPIIRHPDYPFILASLDGVTEAAVIEAKFGKWTPKWGPDGSDLVPLNYWIQVQHYLLVTGLKIGYLTAMLYGENGLEFKIYNIPADEEWHENSIKRYIEFWEAVEAVRPPEPFNLDDIKARFPQSIPLSRKEATLEIMQKLERYREIKQEVGDLETESESLKFEIARFFEDSEALTFGGKIVSTFKTNKAGRRILNVKDC